MRLRMFGLAGLAACLLMGWACRDWDMYDPRLGSAPGTGGEPAGAGGAAGDGGSSAGGGGAGGEAGAGGTPGCGTVDLLGDDFEDGTPSVDWGVYEYYGDLEETGGDLVLSFDGTSPGEIYYSTHVAYDLRGRALSFELASYDPLSDMKVGMAVYFGGSNTLKLVVQYGQIKYELSDSSGHQELATELFDADEHRFFRIRADAASAYFETSADGATWDNGADVSLSALGSSLQYVWADLWASSPEAGTIRLDNINGGTPSTEGFCPVAQLVDDFDASTFSEAWQDYNTDIGCRIELDQNEVALEIDAGLNISCRRGSSSSYDMTDGFASIEVIAPPPMGEPVWVRFSVQEDGDDVARLLIDAGELVLERSDDGNYYLVSSVAFSATDHRFLRFRHGEGQLHWEASPDGSTWSPLASVQSFFDPTRVLFQMDIGSGTPTVDVASRIDNFNVTR